MWKIEVLHIEKGWIHWLDGSLEQVLSELFDFRSGQYMRSYTQARITSPEREQ